VIAPSAISTATRALEKEVKGHQRKLRRAGARALNKTATKGRNVSSRVIRKTLNLKAKTVKDQLKVTRATPDNHRSTVQGRYKPVPLIKFNGVRQTKKGVTVRMRKDKPRMVFKGAFIARMPSGHIGVFRRTSRSRLPIKQIYGPPVSKIMGDKLPEIINQTAPDLEKTLAHEIQYELSKG